VLNYNYLTEISVLVRRLREDMSHCAAIVKHSKVGSGCLEHFKNN